MSRSVCLKCKTEFSCGATTNEPCWCIKLPNVIPVTSGECMCPDCLAREIREMEKEKRNLMTYKYEDNLETERLRTHFLSSEDVKTWMQFLSNEECTKFFPKAVFKTPEEHAVFWINKQLDRYKENRYGLQALINKKTGEFIGQCGLLLQEVDGKQELEVGYHIMREHWGKGYAIEAARMFKTYGFKNHQSDTIISIIHCDNKRSQNVATKNGMKREKASKWNGLDVLIFRTNE